MIPFLSLILFAALPAGPQSDTAGLSIPRLDQRVTDFTNTLSYVEWSTLEYRLKHFEDTASTQVVVLMVKSLQGDDIEDFANKVFEANGIGQKSRNNGVLLVVAKDDRKIKIEVGYGLEGVLTDALSSEIIRNEIAPKFREGNFFDGLLNGVVAIMAATAGEYHAGAGKSAPTISAGLLVAMGIFVFYFLMPMIASRRRYVFGSRGARYYGGWGYGGWGGGFGGGSFGGGGGGWSGGGGMSGGGGASGGW
ncbi:MAG TPA: TPM domain-containing protein [Bacteroidota bacterium]|nr:TPM domain-containing protein [Bacteroidota bacterium]